MGFVTVTTVLTVTCDGCGIKQKPEDREPAGRGVYKVRWVKVGYNQADAEARYGQAHRLAANEYRNAWDLCPDCDRQLRLWMLNRTLRDPGGDE